MTCISNQTGFGMQELCQLNPTQVQAHCMANAALWVLRDIKTYAIPCPLCTRLNAPGTPCPQGGASCPDTLSTYIQHTQRQFSPTLTDFIPCWVNTHHQDGASCPDTLSTYIQHTQRQFSPTLTDFIPCWVNTQHQDGASCPDTLSTYTQHT